MASPLDNRMIPMFIDIFVLLSNSRTIIPVMEGLLKNEIVPKKARVIIDDAQNLPPQNTLQCVQVNYFSQTQN